MQMETAVVSLKKIRNFFSHGQTKMNEVYHLKKITFKSTFLNLVSLHKIIWFRGGLRSYLN